MKKLFDHPDILLFAAAVLIYTAGIFTRSLGGDEYLMAVMVRDFVRNGRILCLYDIPFPVLPLYLTGWLFKFTGFAPWSLRLTGMIAVLLSSAVLKVWGNWLFNRNAGQLTALLYLLGFGVWFNATGAYAGNLAAGFYLAGIVLIAITLHRKNGLIPAAAGGIILSLAAFCGMVYLPVISLAGLAAANCRNRKCLTAAGAALLCFAGVIFVRLYWNTLPEMAHLANPGKKLLQILPGLLFLPLIISCRKKLWCDIRENPLIRDAAVLTAIILCWTLFTDSNRLPLYAVFSLFTALAWQKLLPDIPEHANVLFKVFPPAVIISAVSATLLCRRYGIELYRDGIQEFSGLLVITLAALLCRMAGASGWDHPGKKICFLAAFSLALMFNFPALVPRPLLARYSPHGFFRQIHRECGSPGVVRILADRISRPGAVWALRRDAALLPEDENPALINKKTTMVFLSSREYLKKLPPGVIFSDGQWCIVYYP